MTPDDRTRRVRAIFDRSGDRWSAIYAVPGKAHPRFALFDSAVRERVQRRRRLAMELLACQEGERVVDVGCGNGAYAGRVAAAGGLWVGIDQSLPMLHAAADRPEARSLTIQATGTALPLGAESTDAVLCVGVLSYYDRNEIERILVELHRILRPGGRAVLSALRLDPITWIRSRLYPVLPVPLAVPGPLHPRGARRMLPLTDSAGFELRRVRHVRKYGVQPHYSLLLLEKPTAVGGPSPTLTAPAERRPSRRRVRRPAP